METFLKTLQDWSYAVKRYPTLIVTVVLLAVLATSCVANAQTKPQLNLCTGAESGNYFYAGNVLKKYSQSANVNVIETRGSVDNLDRILAGQCDAAFVQTDALRVYGDRNPRIIPAIERAQVLYEEYVHFLCNREQKLGRITDLTSKHTVAIGPDGSGSAVSWAAMVAADKKKYGNIPTDPRSGVRALSAVADGTQVQCMLFTAALKPSLITNDATPLAQRIVMVPANDRDFDGAKDQRGRKIYTFKDIPANLYGALQPSGLMNYKAVETVTVEAVLVVSSNWIAENERQYDGVLRAAAQARPEILKKVGQFQ